MYDETIIGLREKVTQHDTIEVRAPIDYSSSPDHLVTDVASFFVAPFLTRQLT